VAVVNVSVILAGLALALVVVSAAGKAPLWAAVFVLAVWALLVALPAR
jgi:hypothetical protein